MNPQPRGEVPADHRRRLVAAVEAMASARTEFELAIADALKAGASIREVAKLTPLSHRQVLEIGHRHGWPTEAQKAAKAKKQEWRRDVFAAMDEIKKRRGDIDQ